MGIEFIFLPFRLLLLALYAVCACLCLCLCLCVCVRVVLFFCLPYAFVYRPVFGFVCFCVLHMRFFRSFGLLFVRLFARSFVNSRALFSSAEAEAERRQQQQHNRSLHACVSYLSLSLFRLSLAVVFFFMY